MESVDPFVEGGLLLMIKQLIKEGQENFDE